MNLFSSVLLSLCFILLGVNRILSIKRNTLTLQEAIRFINSVKNNIRFSSMDYDTLIETAKKEKRLGVVLTCKKQLVSYYSKFGFVDEGISESKHGGEVWNQMRLTFD